MELKNKSIEVRYSYSSMQEKMEHAKEMKKKGYVDTGLKEHDIRDLGGGYKYALCGSYEKELKI